MFEIQPDWLQLNEFTISFMGVEYKLKRTTEGIKCDKPDVTAVKDETKSIRFTTPNGSCLFIAPSLELNTHGKSAINCIDVLPDASEVLSGDAYGHLMLDHIGTDPVPLEGPSPDFDIRSCICDHERKLFICAGADFRIYVFSAVEYSLTTTLTGHMAGVRSLALYNDYLLSGGGDGNVIFWDNKFTKSSTISAQSPINDMFVHHDHLFVATDASIKAYNLTNMQPIAHPVLSDHGLVLTICADDKFIAAGFEDGTVAVWPQDNISAEPKIIRWYDCAINRLRFRKQYLWIATNDGTVVAINMENDACEARLGTKSFWGVQDIAFDNAGIWTCDSDGTILRFPIV